MSIFPATDLVTEVVRAADPQRLNAAVTRFADLSSKNARPEDFASLVEGAKCVSKSEAAPSAAATYSFLHTPTVSSGASSVAGTIKNARVNDATEKFALARRHSASEPKHENKNIQATSM